MEFRGGIVNHVVEHTRGILQRVYSGRIELLYQWCILMNLSWRVRIQTCICNSTTFMCRVWSFILHYHFWPTRTKILWKFCRWTSRCKIILPGSLWRCVLFHAKYGSTLDMYFKQKTITIKWNDDKNIFSIN